jgi:hypothetical protein
VASPVAAGREAGAGCCKAGLFSSSALEQDIVENARAAKKTIVRQMENFFIYASLFKVKPAIHISQNSQADTGKSHVSQPCQRAGPHPVGPLAGLGFNI